ncbi:MAG: VWA domain-containing protein [Thermodesulfobacteriota bacterium]|nr:VWA domain-containing protein [Thermodesulfobacteriota bacterium]
MTETSADIQKKGIIQSMLLFCRILGRLKINITMGRVLDSISSLKHINIADREDFYHALKANLVSHQKDIPVFDQAFQHFWRFSEDTKDAQKTGDDENDNDEREEGDKEQGTKEGLFIESWTGEKPDGAEDEAQIPEYSPVETLATKDFSAFTDEDVKKIQEVIVQIASKIATKKSRRRKLDPRGDELALRQTLRMNLKYGGDVFQIARRKRKIKKTKLIALADVSGSMDSYSRFFVQFIYGMQDRLSGVETFVFSTHLTRVTEVLKKRDMGDALNEIAKNVLHWSGGTKIGSCLQAFNNEYAPTMLNGKSVVVIISDGWDTGNTGLLETEIKKLKEHCHKIIWLNPLLGSPDYQPLCRGIQAVMPHLSYFLPLHNLNSLIALGKTLRAAL